MPFLFAALNKRSARKFRRRSYSANNARNTATNATGSPIGK
jgi:hypothetical protein